MGCYHFETTFPGGGPNDFNQITFTSAAIDDMLGSPGDFWEVTASTPIGHSDMIVREFVDPGPSEYFLTPQYLGDDGSRAHWRATGIRVGADPDTFMNIRWGVDIAGLYIVDICSTAGESAPGWKVGWG